MNAPDEGNKTSEYLGFVAHETFGNRVDRVKDQ
jgi:hypothetical protein